MSWLEWVFLSLAYVALGIPMTRIYYVMHHSKLTYAERKDAFPLVLVTFLYPIVALVMAVVGVTGFIAAPTKAEKLEERQNHLKFLEREDEVYRKEKRIELEEETEKRARALRQEEEKLHEEQRKIAFSGVMPTFPNTFGEPDRREMDRREELIRIAKVAQRDQTRRKLRHAPEHDADRIQAHLLKWVHEEEERIRWVYKEEDH